MKALPLLLFALLVLTGCASTSTANMSEEDRFIWGEDSTSSASTAQPK